MRSRSPNTLKKALAGLRHVVHKKSKSTVFAPTSVIHPRAAHCRFRFGHVRLCLLTEVGDAQACRGWGEGSGGGWRWVWVHGWRERRAFMLEG